MNLKKYMAIVLVFSALFIIGCSSPPTDVDNAKVLNDTDSGELVKEVNANSQSVPVNNEKSSFEFTGYGPGKSHVGTFEFYSANLLIDETGTIVGVSGTIDASSVKSDSERLDSHLKNDDFFDVEKYPTIEFRDGIINGETMKGYLIFRGVTKYLEVPVIVTTDSVTSEFLLDTTEFNFKYTGIEKDVKIKFVMSK